MVVYKHLVLLLICLMTIGSVSAANWYVDNTASGSNGQSWGSAWNSFSSIQWSSINPGDTIYISGGTSSKTYSETLNVDASGNSGNLVTIRKGIEPDHRGDVIIDRNFVSGYGLDLRNIDYVNVRDLHVQNTGSNAVFVRDATYIYLDNLEIRNANGQLIFLQGYTSEDYPWTIPGIDHFYLRNSLVEDTRSAPYQTDLIVAYYAVQNVFLLNNVLRVGNTDSAEHTDNIQWYWGVKNVTIAGNWIENLGGVDGGIQNQGMMTGLSYGLIRVYNNVFYTPNFGDGVDPIYGAKAMNTIWAGTSENAKWELMGNTFVTGYNTHLLYLETPQLTMRNNIFYHLRSMSGTSVKIMNMPTAWSEISNNFYSDNTVPPNGKPISVDSSSRSIQEIQNMYGGEINSISDQNPFFVNIANKDFSLQEISSGVDGGISLGPPFNIDYLGVTRPQGSGWDIGAYEFGGSVSFHSADLNQNGCVDIGEIVAYVDLWKDGLVTIQQVVAGVEAWQQGCP